MGLWRTLYYIFGWDYPKDLWCPRQRDLKYQMCLQIQKSEIRLNPVVRINKNVVFDLPPRFSDIPPPPSSPIPPLEDCSPPPLEVIDELKSVLEQKNKKRKYKRKRH